MSCESVVQEDLAEDRGMLGAEPRQVQVSGQTLGCNWAVAALSKVIYLIFQHKNEKTYIQIGAEIEVNFQLKI